MNMYHRKHETKPTDKTAETKLLSLENKLHKQKGLSKDKVHAPPKPKSAKKK